MRDRVLILLQCDSCCGKTCLFQELVHVPNNDDYVQLFLYDSMDANTLMVNSVCMDVRGEFVFHPGTLMHAIISGKWIVIEDIDSIVFAIVSTLLPINENVDLSIPSRGLTIPVHPNFRLFGSSCDSCTASNSPSYSFLSNHWHVVDVAPLSLYDLRDVIASHFPQLRHSIVVSCWRGDRSIECFVATYHVV